MELKAFVKLFRAERRLIASVTLLTALAAAGSALWLNRGVEASVSLFLDRSGTQATDQYKYDGYYALYAGEIVADNVEKLLTSPQVVEAIYRQAGIDPRFEDLKHYKKRFTAHKMSNQYVEVSFSAASRPDAGRISQSLLSAVNANLAALQAQSQNEVAFAAAPAAPVIIEKRADLPLTLGLGLVSGLALGLFAALLKKYFQD